MLKRCIALFAVIALSLSLAGQASAQIVSGPPSPSPEAIAAAKEVMVTMKVADQYKVLMPTIIAAIKPAIVQGRPNVERDFDAMSPVMLEAFQSRMNDMIDAVAMIYARNFSVGDLRALNDFFKTSAGQSFVQKMPVISQQSMLAGQQIGQALAGEFATRAREELRKKGHDI